jgi:hypothetical protein
MDRWFTPLRLAALVTALDFVWAAQAMGSVPRHAGSNVAMVSLVLWVVLHLPAAALASFVFYAVGALKGPAGSLPGWSFVLLAALGLGQTFSLVYCWALWRRRTP